MRWIIPGLGLLFGAYIGLSHPGALAQATAPAPAQGVVPAATAPATQARAKHAVIFSIDGCRPDVLLRADTPIIHNLLKEAAFTFYAETTDIAITLPSHTSMLTGVKPATHGINFNSDPPDGVYPKVPTVLEIAHAHGLTTGVFSTKSKFTVFTRPNTIDYVAISKESSSADDIGIANKAAEAIKSHKPGAMLVHFGNNDRTGHAKGWDSPEQLEALAGADKSVGIVLQALKDAGIYNDTLIIISADHGGSGTNHGDKLQNGEKDWRSRYIPWIAVGPGVRKNYDLTNVRSLAIHTEDTFATACYFLGLPIPAGIDGKPVTQIIANRNLVMPVPPASARNPATTRNLVTPIQPATTPR